ncbi:MAG: glycerophosphodiester phosphodiesterase family protein [Jiangellales bacterium]
MSLARPMVVGHRGASGRFPEHTEAALVAAIDDGADVIEVDVVATADNVLVARHDWALSVTTDVADRVGFSVAHQKRDGRFGPVTDWWVDLVTSTRLAELRARERWPQVRPDSASADGQWPVLTLREVLHLARREAGARGRPVGVAIELKDVGAARSVRGLDVLAALAGDLAAVGESSDVPIWVMAFEAEPLSDLWGQRSAGMLPGVVLVQLVEYTAPSGGRAWESIAARADVVGPCIDLVLASAGATDGASVLADAAAHRLPVWCWTFRAENAFLPVALRSSDDQRELGGMAEQVLEARRSGVAALIGDQPALIRHALSVAS